MNTGLSKDEQIREVLPGGDWRGERAPQRRDSHDSEGHGSRWVDGGGLCAGVGGVLCPGVVYSELEPVYARQCDEQKGQDRELWEEVGGESLSYE